MGQLESFEQLNFRTLFESAPALYLVLTPDLKIVAASDAYLRATMTTREAILGRGLFDVFPDNPDDPHASGVRNLKASLDRVLARRVPDTMAIQKYDIRRPGSEGGGFEERFWSPVNSPVFGRSNELEYIIHRVEDVTEVVRLKQRGTEQEKATQELRTRAEQMEVEVDVRAQELATFQLLFSHNPLPMWVYDLETLAFLEVNGTAVALYGYSREEFLRMRLGDIRPADEVPRLEETVDRMASAETEQTIRHAGTWQHRLKDGRVIAVEVITQSMQFAGRRAALVVALDVTELKRTQEALAKHVERLRILHEIDRALLAGDVPVAIAEAVLRPLRDLLGVPRAIVNMFDLATGEVEWLAAVGRRRIRLGPGIRYSMQLMGDVEALRRGELQVIDVDAMPPSSEAQALLASGVHTYMVVPMIAGGELIGALSFGGERGPFPAEQVSVAQEAATQLAIAIVQARLRERVQRQAEELERRVEERTRELSAANDQLGQEIAERRRAESEADRANRAKSEFLSRMSHELRTPLNAILGFAQLLEMDEPSSEQKDSVGQILRAGSHLLGLINEVLDISRIEMGRHQMSLEPVPVDETLRHAMELVQPSATGSGVSVRAKAIDERLHVLADRQRLQQVLLNLLSNAIKYNRSSGTVTASCEHVSEARLRISVADTGQGIAADKLARLFTPFDRLGAEASGVEGTGLGLALSKSLVEAMGGTIHVQSQEGHGSTFSVELRIVPEPVATDADASAVLVPRAEEDKPGPARRILFIEDNLSNVRLVESVLRRRPGITVVSAMQARVGLALARDHRPDLILLDRHLPDMPGDEAFFLLRDDPRTRDIPVIVLSADAIPSGVQRLLDVGVSAYLLKPLDVHALLAAIDECFQRNVR